VFNRGGEEAEIEPMQPFTEVGNALGIDPTLTVAMSAALLAFVVWTAFAMLRS
jgi:hypothetical protein